MIPERDYEEDGHEIFTILHEKIFLDIGWYSNLFV